VIFYLDEDVCPKANSADTQNRIRVGCLCTVCTDTSKWNKKRSRELGNNDGVVFVLTLKIRI
jgi:hypothetical protein